MSGFGQRFGDKGDVPHYFHDTHATMMIRKFYAKLVMHAPMWILKHQVFYGHVTLGLRIHFPYFKSTQYFQNTFFYQFVHSFESILGVRENFHSIHPSGVYTFFQKLVMISKFFQRKVGSHLFSKACWFFS